MKTSVTLLFFFACATLLWLFAQRPLSPAYGKPSQLKQFIRVGIDFGNPAKNCQGRGTLCRIRQLAEKTLFRPSWAEAEGRLYFTRSGHFELDILKTGLELSHKDGLPPLQLPVLFQPDSLQLEFVLPDLPDRYPEGVVLPPGRYEVIETESRYILQW